jgi:hypothetical protein
MLMNVLRSARIDSHATNGIALETRVGRGNAHLRWITTCFKFIFLVCLAAERTFKFANYAVGYAMLYIGFTRRKCRVFNFIILQRL